VRFQSSFPLFFKEINEFLFINLSFIPPLQCQLRARESVSVPDDEPALLLVEIISVSGEGI
jgi:hypothetical protein